MSWGRPEWRGRWRMRSRRLPNFMVTDAVTTISVTAFTLFTINTASTLIARHRSIHWWHIICLLRRNLESSLVVLDNEELRGTHLLKPKLGQEQSYSGVRWVPGDLCNADVQLGVQLARSVTVC